MATEGKNLSQYDKNSMPNGASFSFGIVVSEWNDNITDNLCQGALDVLLENGVSEDNIIIEKVPGAYELAIGSQYLFEYTNVDAVVAIGSVIEGETRHFQDRTQNLWH